MEIQRGHFGQAGSMSGEWEPFCFHSLHSGTATKTEGENTDDGITFLPKIISHSCSISL